MIQFACVQVKYYCKGTILYLIIYKNIKIQVMWQLTIPYDHLGGSHYIYIYYQAQLHVDARSRDSGIYKLMQL